MGFGGLWSLLGGSRPGFLVPWPYFRVCVSVAVFLSTETSLVALWGAFYIEDKRLDLDTLRVPNRPSTPTSPSKDFRGQFDDIWGAPDPHFRPILGVPGVRAGLENTYCLAF